MTVASTSLMPGTSIQVPESRRRQERQGAGALGLSCCARLVNAKEPSVEPEILAGRTTPRIVGRHSVPHQRRPPVFHLKGSQSSIDCVQKGGAAISLKGEAVAPSRSGVEPLDAILQAAGRPDDGDCSVFQAVELIESAGLVAGRHE